MGYHRALTSSGSVRIFKTCFKSSWHRSWHGRMLSKRSLSTIAITRGITREQDPIALAQSPARAQRGAQPSPPAAPPSLAALTPRPRPRAGPVCWPAGRTRFPAPAAAAAPRCRAGSGRAAPRSPGPRARRAHPVPQATSSTRWQPCWRSSPSSQALYSAVRLRVSPM